MQEILARVSFAGPKEEARALEEALELIALGRADLALEISAKASAARRALATWTRVLVLASQKNDAPAREATALAEEWLRPADSAEHPNQVLPRGHVLRALDAANSPVGLILCREGPRRRALHPRRAPLEPEGLEARQSVRVPRPAEIASAARSRLAREALARQIEITKRDPRIATAPMGVRRHENCRDRSRARVGPKPAGRHTMRTRTWRTITFLSVLAGCTDLPAEEPESTLDPLRVPDAEGGWCARIAGGTDGPTDVALALSRAHAEIRYFGAARSNMEIDSALVTGLARAGGEVSAAAAAAFAGELESVCWVASDSRPLPVAATQMRGDVAIVRPGTGEVSIPPEAKAVALDLRDLPNAPGLAAALDTAVSSILATPVPPLQRRVHARMGLTDEAFSPQSIYSTGADLIPSPQIVATAPQRPVAIVVGRRIAPDAAQLAANLRVTNSAWIFGEDLPVAVAEVRWGSFGTRGLAYRTADLEDARGRLPDILPADAPATDASFARLSTRGAPPTVVGAHPTRVPIAQRVDFGVQQPGTVSPATARAALLSAHGAATLFFPYFGATPEVTTAAFDARLKETLASASGVTDRASMRTLLRRLGHALHDGHNWVIDEVEAPSGVIPILLDRVQGAPVVARSYEAALPAGATLLTIDGKDARAWFDTEMGRAYGGTDGARFFNAANELLASSRRLKIRLPNGLVRTVNAQAVVPSEDVDLFAGSTRGRGWLSDLGAPSVYYLNLDGRYARSDAEVDAGLREAAGARALILDMRGHPANGGADWNPYTLLQRVIGSSFSSPRYRVPLFMGPADRSDHHPHEETFSPLAPHYAGRIILLTDGQAVSFAEDFSMMLTATGRATVVGRPTAGTTGSVTGMQLPAGFAFYLTGMEARWPDGRNFFGEGTVPTVPVTPTVEDYAAGIDPFIVRALEVLRR